MTHMSKLKRLIEEFCPEGVEYKHLGEIGTFERGRRFVKADAVESNGIPCVHYGEVYTYYGLWANEHKSQIRTDIQTKLRFAEKNDVIIVGAGENNIDIGIAVAWLGDYKVAVHDACYIFKHQQDPKYISYLLRTNSYHQQIKKFVSEGKICSISAESLAKAVLPFPPVPVQKEIVRILDKYTQVEAELETELKAELDARKQQYEYYRNLLLDFTPTKSENTNFFKMGDIGFFYGGLSGKTKSDFNRGNAKYVTYMNVYNNISVQDDMLESVDVSENEKQNRIQYGDVLFTGSSETQEECGMSSVVIKQYSEPIYLNSFCFGYRLNNSNLFDTDFMKHLFRGLSLRKQIIKTASGVTRFNISKKRMQDIVLPCPAIKEQKRIANILDRFEALSTSLLEDLPVEISVRRQQYEYYREKLLTFKRKVA